MNERMLELARQAGLKKEHGSDREYIGDFDWRLFGDLLVKECTAVCDDIAEMAEITNTGDVARKTKATAVSCSNFIKSRFGVKS
jgi:hypothetical protein